MDGPQDVRDSLCLAQMRRRMVSMDVATIKGFEQEKGQRRHRLFGVVLHLLDADEIQVLDFPGCYEPIEISFREFVFC